MKLVMGKVEHFAKLEDVWLDGKWTPADVTNMWSTIWPRIEPFMRTLTPLKNGGVTNEKSRQGQISWRTVYNKLLRHGKNWIPSRHAQAITRTNELTGASLKNGEVTDEKSRQGQIAWRTVYNKLFRHGKNWIPSRHAQPITRANELTGASKNGGSGPSESEHHEV